MPPMRQQTSISPTGLEISSSQAEGDECFRLIALSCYPRAKLTSRSTGACGTIAIGINSMDGRCASTVL